MAHQLGRGLRYRREPFFRPMAATVQQLGFNQIGGMLVSVNIWIDPSCFFADDHHEFPRSGFDGCGTIRKREWGVLMADIPKIYLNQFVLFSSDMETQILGQARRPALDAKGNPTLLTEEQVILIMTLDNAKQLRDALTNNINQHEAKKQAAATKEAKTQ